MMKKIFIFMITLLASIVASGQTTEVAAKKIRATEKLQLVDKTFTSIVQVINVASTHSQCPTAKAVYDLTSAMLTSIATNATLSGTGTVGDPGGIAQQGATSGQVLKWNGSTWLPAADDNTLQNLSLTGQALGISSGTGVTLPVVGVSAGTGVSVSSSAGVVTVTNTSPNTNQNLSLTGQALGISSGTGVTLPVVGVAAGTGISVSTSSGVVTVTNTAGSTSWIYDGNTTGANRRIGTNDAFAVAIETAGTDRMYFNNAGKIGVGNTAPDVSMDFTGKSDGVILPSGNTAARPTVLGNFLARNLRYLGATGLEISNTSNQYHQLTSGVTPSYVVGTAAGTSGGGAAAGSGGNELSALVSITVGSSPAASGVVFTRTFGSVMTHAPTVTFSAGNSLTASEITKFYALATTSGYTLYTNSTLQVGANKYVLNIQIRN